MTAASWMALANHLWQSTLAVGVAALLASALRRNRARVRHAVWFAASLKFLVPLSVLIALGGNLRRHTQPAASLPSFSIAMEKFTRPFAGSVASSSGQDRPAASSPLPGLLLGLWVCGFLGIAGSWYIRWRRIRTAARSGSPLPLDLPVPAMSSDTLLEPGIFGVFRPVLLLPEGIFDRLAPAQLEVIVAHELCHVRNRDNLFAAVHMLVEAVFWFHPLVWWLGKRLVDERERACDEEVLQLGGNPRVYAEAILNVCKLYLASPVVCVSGVTGSSGLRNRIEAILANRVTHSLSAGRKCMLAAAAIAVVALPLIVGIQTAPLAIAGPQAASLPASFDVASIKPAAIAVGHEGGNRSRIEYTPTSLTMRNVDLSQCVQWAYGVAFYQLSGANRNSDSYDILAKSGSPVPVSQLRIMLQNLLAKRFQLALHRETKMVPAYELAVAKGGPRLPKPKTETSLPPSHAAESLPRVQGDNFVFADISIPEFAAMLTQLRGVELPVVDRTGIKGTFDIVLKSGASVTRDSDVSALFALIQEQLGLRLVNAKAPLEVLVIDRAEKPSEN